MAFHDTVLIVLLGIIIPSLFFIDINFFYTDSLKSSPVNTSNSYNLSDSCKIANYNEYVKIF